MLLTNGSKYNIFNVQHIVRKDLIFEEPIPLSNKKILEELYLVIKYTTEFFEKYNIDYCIEGGTLLGYHRHDGIIPWDNDVDIMIFKDGYYKLKNLIKQYNNKNHEILNINPGFKLFYNKVAYGELIVYDLDKNSYKMAYPYINNQSTFFMTNMMYHYADYSKESLFPTKKVLFEDFYVRIPNNPEVILKKIYKGNLLNCIYMPEKNKIHESITYNKYLLLYYIESFLLHPIFPILNIIYLIICKLFIIFFPEVL